MIKRLRRKLIAAAMLALLLVLVITMGALNIINYRGVVAQADTTLSLLAEGGGSFPGFKWSSGGDNRNPPSDENEPQPRRSYKYANESFSAELPFMSRYFSVVYDADGGLLFADTARVAAIDETAAVEMAGRVMESGRESGFLFDYRYTTVHAPDDGTRVIFLDCTRELETYRRFLWGSCSVSAVGLGAVFVLMVLFSVRIIRPVSESYAKQRRFITDAGHELKTPLTIIDADAELLEMDLGEGNEWLRDIRRQVGRLSRLTADLIYLSRMDEERAETQMIEFPFTDVVTETAQSFAAPAMTGEKHFSLAVEPMLTLCGDEKGIRQLVSILLDNALKYSPPGGEIAMTARRAGRGILLTVSNTAEPMDSKTLSRLFDRFYRADQARSGGGYGLGLSIARAIVTAHRGKISAAYEGGKLTISVMLS